MFFAVVAKSFHVQFQVMISHKLTCTKRTFLYHCSSLPFSFSSLSLNGFSKVRAFQTSGFGRKVSKLVIVTPCAKMKEERINEMASDGISALAVLRGTYGVLSALVISEKASLTFSSWTFVIWFGVKFYPRDTPRMHDESMHMA
jgi:hypothetical protein